MLFAIKNHTTHAFLKIFFYFEYSSTLFFLFCVDHEEAKDDQEQVLDEAPQTPRHVTPRHVATPINGETGASFPAIWSEEGKYLATVLGDALVKGLTQVSQDRPEDPVEYLANFLKTYKNGEILASNIPKEVEERLKSGRALTPGLMERNGLIQGQGGHPGDLEEEEAEEEGVGQEAELDLESQQLIKNLDSDDDELDQINNLDEQDDPADEEEDQGTHQNGTRDDRGQSVLHFAAARPGGASTILAFLQNPSVNLAWRDEKLRTARDVAVGLGRVENVKTIDGWIISLAIAGDLASLSTLLLDGYDAFNVEDSSKTHIIDLAEKAGKREVALFLRGIPDFKEKLEKLFQAVKVGDLEAVRELTLQDRKLAVAIGANNGMTPLHIGVLFEEFAVVKYLVERFGNGTGEVSVLKRGDFLDRTPLHYAMGVEKVEKMTRVLVRNGAKRVVKDLRGRQPSYYFINRDEIVHLQQQQQQQQQ